MQVLCIYVCVCNIHTSMPAIVLRRNQYEKKWISLPCLIVFSLQNFLSLWENPKNISSMEQIREMKETLTKSINGLRERKDHLNRQQIYNTEAVAQEQLLPQLPNHGTIYQGSHEGINPSMIHGSVGCSTQPNMLTGSMGSKQVFNFQDSYQQPNYNMSSLENFNRGLDQVHPEGLSFNPMQQFEAIDPSNANHFNPMQQFEPTCQSYVNHFPHPNSEPSVNPTWQP
ncbi:hypothetical protein HHK36_003025 [Tetracentron sinense]|uniref:Uncharacterized protein n=1 Tax=Tetracentron sinense TaxID=13715 RepID=A0A834ZXJ9_TETSI|nr:hypothetical protein HHK36_003025 [Tetracentron sinense]